MNREVRQPLECVESWNNGTWTVGKIVSCENLLKIIAEVRLDGGKIVFTNGCFDLLHTGHVTYLNEAKGLGDLLVVGLNNDASVRRLKGPGRPVKPVDQRAEALIELPCVDYVCVFEEDTPECLISAVRPNVLAKGGDYRVEEVVGADILRAYGGQVVTLSYVKGESTTEFLQGVKAFQNEERKGNQPDKPVQ